MKKPHCNSDSNFTDRRKPKVTKKFKITSELITAIVMCATFGTCALVGVLFAICSVTGTTTTTVVTVTGVYNIYSRNNSTTVVPATRTDAPPAPTQAVVRTTGVRTTRVYFMHENPLNDHPGTASLLINYGAFNVDHINREATVTWRHGGLIETSPRPIAIRVHS